MVIIYLLNKGCMHCPLADVKILKYLAKFYPNEFE